MAEAGILRVAEAAMARWPLQALRVIHRHGLVRPGDGIVLVVTASSHRVAAFEAAAFLLAHPQTPPPFWTRQPLPDRTPGGWVDATAHDQPPRSRWG